MKEQRQRKIVSLIRGGRVATQSELAQRLERAGFAVTQSSVSRDVEELGIVKRQGRYVVPTAEAGARSRGLIDLVAAGESLIVARCEPGLASAVAVEIDGASLNEIVGTIAGEDTIFIAVSSARSQRAAIKKLWELFA
jgi:transcriptional regulator of arginine metabolism